MGFRHFWENPHYNIFSEARAAKKMGDFGFGENTPSVTSLAGPMAML
jgi:hypothetical protein